jgi:hypothetical protein
MPKSHAAYIFSITVRTEDLAVLTCLRALSNFAQQTGNNRMPSFAASDRVWLRDGHKLTFRFTKPAFRAAFLLEARRLLPNDSFEFVGQNDNDAASLEV